MEKLKKPSNSEVLYILFSRSYHFGLTGVISGVKYITVLKALCIESLFFELSSLHVRFEVLTAVIMKSTIFGDIKRYSPSTDISEENIASIFRLEE
jgi:hypothetical protein